MRICPGFAVAKARGDVRHGPDAGIVETALEADSPERSKAVRDTDPKADLVPEGLQSDVNAPSA
jgi:hypothetical protein